MLLKDADGMANWVETDQTAPKGAVWSVSTLFAQTCLSSILNFYGIEWHQVKKDLLACVNCEDSDQHTVELKWLEHWWLVYHDCFELVLESLGKNLIAADLVLFRMIFCVYIENSILCILYWEHTTYPNVK